MDLPERFREHINVQHLFSPKDQLLLAVSGGLDSVVLCELCRQTGFGFRILHCNFQLRGKESERDAGFVKDLAEKYGVPFLVRNFDTENYAAEHKCSIQEAARKLRYTWFEELVSQSAREPDCYLLTAHHADDNTETLLMHFFRGTGLHGLTGIPAKNAYIRRPLLAFTREEILAFARANQLEWVEDSSNESSKYTRNYFRNELIPALEKVFPRVKENLLDNVRRFQETEALYQLAVQALKAKLIRKKGEELQVPVRQLLGYRNRALVYEIIREYGFTEKQIDAVIQLGNSESGHYLDSPAKSYRLIRHRHWFIISPAQSAEAVTIILEKNSKAIRFQLGSLTLEETSNHLHHTQNPCEEYFNLAEIRFPLLLRRWKPGDYFYPLGMRKKKKIARFLIDLKLSKSDKEKVWVLESGKRILWVIGYRIDDRFRVTPQTNACLKLGLSPAGKN